MLVVVNDFLNFRYLNLISADFKYQPQRMYQVHCKLPFTVTNKLMTSPDPILDEHLNGISGTDLVDALMNKTRSSITVLLSSVGGVRTDLLDLSVSIIDLHDHLLSKFYLCGKTTIAAKLNKDNIDRRSMPSRQ